MVKSSLVSMAAHSYLLTPVFNALSGHRALHAHHAQVYMQAEYSYT